MRARLIEVPEMIRKYGLKDAILGWWEDWPCKRRDFWSLLLFQPGQGWFRWKVEHGIDIIGYEVPEAEPYTYAPPLRRFWWYVKGWLGLPYLMIVGYRVHEMWTEKGAPKRQRLTFAESRPTWGDMEWMRDDQRYADLWGWNWKTQRKRARERKRKAVA